MSADKDRPLTAEFAATFARNWIEAWNSHDLERILSHYSDDFEMCSPFIAQIHGHSSGKLRGKKEVGAYWQRALEKMPELHFKLIQVTHGVESLCIHYHSVLDLVATEWLLVGSDGKVRQAAAHYSKKNV